MKINIPKIDSYDVQYRVNTRTLVYPIAAHLLVEVTTHTHSHNHTHTGAHTHTVTITHTGAHTHTHTWTAVPWTASHRKRVPSQNEIF